MSSIKKKITGYYNIGSTIVAVPGLQRLAFDLNVGACANGQTFSLEFTFRLDGDIGNKEIILDNLIVISAAPRDNMVLNWDRGTAAYKGTEVEFSDGDYKVYNVGFGFQLYGENPQKGLK